MPAVSQMQSGASMSEEVFTPRRIHGRELAIVRARRAESVEDQAPFILRRLGKMDTEELHAHAHWQRLYQIIWIIQGSGKHYVDLVEHPIQPRMLFFLAPGEVHRMVFSTPISGFSITFTPDFLGLVSLRYSISGLPFARFGHQRPFVVVPVAEAEQVTQTITCLEREFQCQYEDSSEMLRAYLHILLTQAKRALPCPSSTSGTPPSQLVQAFLKLVETQYRQKKQVNEYADVLAVTAGHLNDMVKQGLGKTAGEVIRERVLLEAKRLLLYSDSSVVEIANALGFDDPSYFSRFFRRYIGQTPYEFRCASLREYQADIAL